GPAGALHHGPVGRGLAPHEQRDADHPFASDYGELRRVAALRDVQQRDDALDREEHVLQVPARLIQRGAERQLYQLELRQQALIIRWGQRGEQVVLCRGRHEGHLPSVRYRTYYTVSAAGHREEKEEGVRVRDVL